MPSRSNGIPELRLARERHRRLSRFRPRRRTVTPFVAAESIKREMQSRVSNINIIFCGARASLYPLALRQRRQAAEEEEERAHCVRSFPLLAARRRHTASGPETGRTADAEARDGEVWHRSHVLSYPANFANYPACPLPPVPPSAQPKDQRRRRSPKLPNHLCYNNAAADKRHKQKRRGGKKEMAASSPQDWAIITCHRPNDIVEEMKAKEILFILPPPPNCRPFGTHSVGSPSNGISVRAATEQ